MCPCLSSGNHSQPVLPLGRPSLRRRWAGVYAGDSAKYADMLEGLPAFEPQPGVGAARRHRFASDGDINDMTFTTLLSAQIAEW